MAQPVEFDSNSDGSVSAYPEKRSKPIKVRELLLSEILTKATVVQKQKHKKSRFYKKKIVWPYDKFVNGLLIPK